MDDLTAFRIIAKSKESRRQAKRRNQRRRNYKNGRIKLIEEMGGKCVVCGTKKKLEFHHKEPRDWNPSGTARWVRLARYRREADQGKVELRCRHCNAVAGQPKPLEEAPF
jgi:5-methylcytosine-specific restriction endonuclease McrA